MEKSLPPIPAKRYFTIGEVSELCGVKPYVLRYWEQEFSQLKPMKRRGNRRYYQHHEVLLIRRIRELLYEQGFTISGARNRLAEGGARHAANAPPTHAEPGVEPIPAAEAFHVEAEEADAAIAAAAAVSSSAAVASVRLTPAPAALSMREELLSIRRLLTP
jgi:DNA-binding transcriptional MerR regulator